MAKLLVELIRDEFGENIPASLILIPIPTVRKIARNICIYKLSQYDEKIVFGESGAI